MWWQPLKKHMEFRYCYNDGVDKRCTTGHSIDKKLVELCRHSFGKRILTLPWKPWVSGRRVEPKPRMWLLDGLATWLCNSSWTMKWPGNLWASVCCKLLRDSSNQIKRKMTKKVKMCKMKKMQNMKKMPAGCKSWGRPTTDAILLPAWSPCSRSWMSKVRDQGCEHDWEAALLRIKSVFFRETSDRVQVLARETRRFKSIVATNHFDPAAALHSTTGQISKTVQFPLQHATTCLTKGIRRFFLKRPWKRFQQTGDLVAVLILTCFKSQSDLLICCRFMAYKNCCAEDMYHALIFSSVT